MTAEATKNGPWTIYKIKGRFLDKVFGGLPGDPKLVEGFLASKKELMAPEKEPMKEIIEKSQELSTCEGQMERMSNIFASDENGLFLSAYQFQGGLKDAMSIQKSVSMWRNKMQRGVRVLPARIYLMRDGKNIKQPDGSQQSVVHSEYMGQPQASIKKVDYVDRPEFSFEVWVGNDKEGPILSKKAMENLLAHIEVSGIGAMRTMGMGMCKLTVEG